MRKYKNRKFIAITLIIGIILIIISPFIFTRVLGIIDFSDTGEIGDTIGGITAPISSIIGSILVYYALKAQIEANEIVQSQLQEQRIREQQQKIVYHLTKLLEIIQIEIKEFTYRDTTKRTRNGISDEIINIYHGSDAVANFIRLYIIVKYDKLEDAVVEIYHIRKLKYLLIMTQQLIHKIEHEEIPSEDKVNLKTILSYTYTTNIGHHFNYIESNDEHEMRQILKDPQMDEFFQLNNQITGNLMEIVI